MGRHMGPLSLLIGVFVGGGKGSPWLSVLQMAVHYDFSCRTHLLTQAIVVGMVKTIRGNIRQLIFV